MKEKMAFARPLRHRRLSPDEAPFDALSDQERAKDDDAWQLLDAIAKALK